MCIYNRVYAEYIHVCIYIYTHTHTYKVHIYVCTHKLSWTECLAIKILLGFRPYMESKQLFQHYFCSP